MFRHIFYKIFHVVLGLIDNRKTSTWYPQSNAKLAIKVSKKLRYTRGKEMLEQLGSAITFYKPPVMFLPSGNWNINLLQIFLCSFISSSSNMYFHSYVCFPSFQSWFPTNQNLIVLLTANYYKLKKKILNNHKTMVGWSNVSKIYNRTLK